MSSKVQVTCENKRCGEIFTARIADRKRGWARYCSKSCKALVQEKRTGQYKTFCQRVDSETDHDVGMEAVEAGWDGHKNLF